MGKNNGWVDRAMGQQRQGRKLGGQRCLIAC